MSQWVIKWLSAWLTMVLGIVTICYPPFFAGMARGSLNSGHLDTAFITIAMFVLVWPILLLTTIGLGQSTYKIFVRAAANRTS